jgi:hypothetical protein
MTPQFHITFPAHARICPQSCTFKAGAENIHQTSKHGYVAAQESGGNRTVREQDQSGMNRLVSIIPIPATHNDSVARKLPTSDISEF